MIKKRAFDKFIGSQSIELVFTFKFIRSEETWTFFHINNVSPFSTFMGWTIDRFRCIRLMNGEYLSNSLWIAAAPLLMCFDSRFLFRPCATSYSHTVNSFDSRVSRCEGATSQWNCVEYFSRTCFRFHPIGCTILAMVTWLPLLLQCQCNKINIDKSKWKSSTVYTHFPLKRVHYKMGKRKLSLFLSDGRGALAFTFHIQ